MEMVDNTPEPMYWEKIRLVADILTSFTGPLVILAHEDPDGDAVGSTLGLARALRALGKEVHWIVEPPHFLQFLIREGEVGEPLSQLPEDSLVMALDAGDRHRLAGAPAEGLVINIDHHGSNSRFGHVHIVDPSKAAVALMIKDLIDQLGSEWTVDIATPLLTGLITDTGNFRFANTTSETLTAAAELVGHGVALSELTDRLQLRPPYYFKLLGKVLSTVELHYHNLLVTAHIEPSMLAELGSGEEDTDDFVGAIRYVEGSQIAVFFKDLGDRVKLSIRSRGGVSAQAIAVALGGGGHLPAAGATLMGETLKTARPKVLAAVELELKRAGYR